MTVLVTGGMGYIGSHTCVELLEQVDRDRAALLRSEADELRALPINDAARLIEAKHAEQEQARERTAQREPQLHDPFQRDPRRTDRTRPGPARGL